MEGANHSQERKPLEERAREILGVLRKALPIKMEDYAAQIVAKEHIDPFRVLLITILSQSCTDASALRAYRRLEKQVGAEPEELAEAAVEEIEKAIRVAGLQRQKARALKALGKQVLLDFKGGIENVLELSFENARDSLMNLPKVGPKTADVLLSIWGFPTIPVDTHVGRVARRLGLAPSKGGYDNVRSALMEVFNKEDYKDIPLFFMALGRKVCKARRPLCPLCPIEKYCPYPKKTTLSQLERH